MFDAKYMKLDKLLFRLLFSVALLFSVFLFFIGFHNMDLGQNVRYINAEYHLDLVDYSSIETNRTGMELYILGVNQMLIGFILINIFYLILIEIIKGEKTW